MKFSLVRPWCLLLPLALTACSSLQNLKQVSVDDIKFELASDEADYSKSPKDLIIKVDNNPRMKDSYLIVNARIINPTKAPITYYAHELPIPLQLKLNGESPVDRKVAGRSGKNLRAIRVTIPPMSEVPVEGGLDLSQYKYTGEPTVKVDWEFKYWSGDRPSGELKAKLPPQYREVFLVDGKEVTKDHFDFRRKSRKVSSVLSGVEEITRYVETGEPVPHNIKEEKGTARIYKSNGTQYKPGYVLIEENWSDGKKHILSKADAIDKEFEDLQLTVGQSQKLKSGLNIEVKDLARENLEQGADGISVHIGLKQGKKKQDLYLNLLAPPFYGQRTGEWREHRIELLTVKEKTVLIRIRSHQQKFAVGSVK
jgi:hypothetical protein